MPKPLKVCIFGCSAFTTGELTLAFDWVKRCTRKIELHALVAKSLEASAKWTGAQVTTYPMHGGFLWLSRIHRALEQIAPDVLVVADLLLFHGLPHEVGLRGDVILAGALE